MKTLVIGGTGLISTGITRQLIGDGHDVTLYNRGETDARIPDTVSAIRGDRTEHDRFEEQITDAGPFDSVIDMICFTPADAKSAIHAFGGTIDQFVFCSTVDVYHRPVEYNPVREDAPRHPPVSEYGKQKAQCENIFMDAHEQGAFATTVIRPWHTYGEGGAINHTFGTGTHYIDRIRKGEPIVVHGDGTSVWGPCHRDDVARAFVAALGAQGAFGETYHVTSEECMTWNQYHRGVAAALNAPVPDLVHIPTDMLRQVAPNRTEMLENHFQYSTVFDNSKAKDDLNFEYTIPWQEGVRRTVSWLDEHDRIENSEREPFDDRLIDAWRRMRTDFINEFSA